MFEATRKFNWALQSLFSPNDDITINDIKIENPKLANFSISKQKKYNILSTLDLTKSRGPNGTKILLAISLHLSTNIFIT